MIFYMFFLYIATKKCRYKPIKNKKYTKCDDFYTCVCAKSCIFAPEF